MGLAVAGAFGVGYHESASSRAVAPVAAPRLVDEVRLALASRYYRPVPERVLELGSVSKIISALGDPYTTYLAPQAYRLVRQETARTYSGIGLNVLPSRRGFVVVAMNNGPARRAGIHVGDTIVSIAGRPAKSLTMARAMSYFLGAPGSSIELELQRGSDHVDLRVRRELIAVPAVHARLISAAGRRWGVVELSSFRTGSTVLLRREVRELERGHASGLVLDLRNNPGGLLTQAVGIVSVFLHDGTIVTLDGAHQPEHTLRALGTSTTRLPLVVLVNRWTASSAEVVAGALRDHHRATVVGQRTFGKALVQAVDPLDNGAALELTVARYRTPSGEDVSGVGVRPQIAARDDPRTRADEGLAMALQVLARPTS